MPVSPNNNQIRYQHAYQRKNPPVRWVFSLVTLWKIRTEVRIRGECRVPGISSLFIDLKEMPYPARRVRKSLVGRRGIFNDVCTSCKRCGRWLRTASFRRCRNIIFHLCCRYQSLAGKSVITAFFQTDSCLLQLILAIAQKMM